MASPIPAWGWITVWDVVSSGWVVGIGILVLAGSIPNQLLKLQSSCINLRPTTQASDNDVGISIACDHDGGASAFAFREFASGSHADFQLLLLASDDWAVEVWLMQSVLDAASPSTSAVARLEVNAGTARLWYGARLHEGRRFYHGRTDGEQERKGFSGPRPVYARLGCAAGCDAHGTHATSADPGR